MENSESIRFKDILTEYHFAQHLKKNTQDQGFIQFVSAN